MAEKSWIQLYIVRCQVHLFALVERKRVLMPVVDQGFTNIDGHAVQYSLPTRRCINKVEIGGILFG